MPSLAVSLAALALAAQTSAHLSLINIYGSNSVVGHGFGVNLYGKYPRDKGVAGDAGGDSGIFQTGTDNPSPACGSTPELGPVDIPAWLSQAEGAGLPAAHTNLSVVVGAFQVNRDGGGPMSCEYNEDATAASWKPMFMSLNQAGNSGIQNQVRSNETVIMNFPQGAICTGGWSQAACIVRCRTGVNKRFGGCFAVKLSDSASKAVTTAATAATAALNINVPGDETSADVGIDSDSSASTGNSTQSFSSTMELSDEQISSIAQQVIIQMKQDGLILSASSSQSATLNTTSLSQISQDIQLESNSSSSVVPIAQDNQSSNLTEVQTSANASLSDASDAADNRLYNSTNFNASAIDASDILDSPAHNISSSSHIHKRKPHKSHKHTRKCSVHERKT